MGFLFGTSFIFMVCISYWVNLLKLLWVWCFTGWTSWKYSRFASMIFTLRGFALSGICVFFMVDCFCRYISGSTTLRGLDLVVALSNILDIVLIYYVWDYPIVTSNIDGAGLCSAKINYRAEKIAKSVDDIFGMLYCFGKKSTWPGILSDPVLGI